MLMRDQLVIASISIGLTSFVVAELALEPVLVEASRLSDEVDEPVLVPGNTHTITEEVIAESASNSIADLLEFEAGVSSLSFFGSNQVSSPVLRGFGEGGQLRTKVLVDGLSIGRDDLAVTPFSQIPLSRLESISVLRGGRTVRYGDGASAGAIQLQTKRGDGRFQGSLESSAGSDESYRQRLWLSVPANGWEISLSGEDYRTDGYRDNAGEETVGGAVSVLTPESDWGENRLTVSYSDAHFESPGPVSFAQLREDGRLSFQDGEDFESRSIRISDSLKWNLAEDWLFTARASWLQRERAAVFSGAETDNDSQTWDGEAVVRWKRGQTTLEAGLRGRLGEADFVSGSEVADLERSSFGGFLLSQVELGEKLVISGGVSWDRYRLTVDAENQSNSLDDEANFQGVLEEDGFAFEVGVEYQITDQLEAWARYDRSSRFPVLDEVGFFQGFPSDPPFNANLQAEQGDAVEIGLRWKDEHWEASSNVFLLSNEGEIFFNGFTGLNENLPETLRQGWESRVSWQSDHLRASLSYTAILARFEGGVDDGRLVPLVPKNTVTGSLVWKPFERVSLGVEGSYVSSSPDGNDRGELANFLSFEELPSRVVWNVQGRLQVTDDLTVFCRVNNVFDRSFATVAFSGGFFPAPGRQVFVGGRYEF